jgi:urease accessory protein
VISCASARVAAPAVLREVRSAPPITIRQVLPDQDGTCALCLVGSAAGPLPGDDLTLRLIVDPGAAATLTAAGATIAQGASSNGEQPARLRMEIAVGAGATLCADPGALIVCSGARVDVVVSIMLAADATLTWREVVGLGRTREPPGAATVDWDVRRAGRPLLRQRIDLTDPAHRRWPGLIGDHRRLESTLRVGPAIEAGTTVHSASHVTQKIAEHATLTTRLSG